MNIHALKTWPEAFMATREGRKTADFRKDDRHFKLGDILILQEWSPQTKAYTGEMEVREITDIQRGPNWGIPEGYAMLSVRPRCSSPGGRQKGERWETIE